MSNSEISDSASSSKPRMSPSRLRANTVLPAPMNVIFAMRRRLRLAAVVPLDEEGGVLELVLSDESTRGGRAGFRSHRLEEGQAGHDVHAPSLRVQWKPSLVACEVEW